MSKKTKNVPAIKERKAIAVKASSGMRAIASVDPQALLAQAIDKNLPIESMERLLAMRREMKAEWARDQFFAALAGFQKECPIVEKKHKVMDRDKQTKAVKGERYRYAAIEDLVEQAGPFLERWGFSWTCKPIQTDGKVKASVYAHHKDGHEELTEFEVPLDPDAYMSDPQKAAAALTFATRYSFKAAFGIQTRGEDTDASQEGDKSHGREPILAPRATSPVQDVEAKKPSGPYAEIMQLLSAVEFAPGTKNYVRVFSSSEAMDYKALADQAKVNPEELNRILGEIQDTAKMRRAAIKGA